MSKKITRKTLLIVNSSTGRVLEGLENYNLDKKGSPISSSGEVLSLSDLEDIYSDKLEEWRWTHEVHLELFDMYVPDLIPNALYMNTSTGSLDFGRGWMQDYREAEETWSWDDSWLVRVKKDRKGNYVSCDD